MTSPSTVTARTRVDLVVSGGTIYDGLGGEPYAGDVLVAGDRATTQVMGEASSVGPWNPETRRANAAARSPRIGHWDGWRKRD